MSLLQERYPIATRQRTWPEASSNLRQVEHLLSHMLQDAYGICRECRQEIPPTRLKLKPVALLCTACVEGALMTWQPMRSKPFSSAMLRHKLIHEPLLGGAGSPATGGLAPVGAIAMENPGVSVIFEVGAETFLDDPLAQDLVKDGEGDLDTAEEVAVHPICAR